MLWRFEQQVELQLIRHESSNSWYSLIPYHHPPSGAQAYPWTTSPGCNSLVASRHRQWVSSCQACLYWIGMILKDLMASLYSKALQRTIHQETTLRGSVGLQSCLNVLGHDVVDISPINLPRHLRRLQSLLWLCFRDCSGCKLDLSF